MANRKEKEKKKNTGEKLTMKELFFYVTTAYLFMMLTVFPLYVRKGFVYIAAYKIVFFRNISLLFLGITLILSVVFLAGSFSGKKKGTKPDNVSPFPYLKATLVPLDYAVLLYGLWNVVSFLACDMKGDAIRGFGGWEMGLVVQGLMVFGYFLSRFGYDKSKSAWFFGAGALIAESILVVLHRTGNDPFGFYKGMDWFEWSRRNLLGTIGNINWLCGYLVCVLPMVIVLYVNTKKWYSRLLWGIGMYFCFAAIFLQGSRSGVLALVVLMLVLPAFLFDTIPHLTRYVEILFSVFIFWAQMSVFRVDLIEPMSIHTPQTVYSYLWLIPAGIFGVAVFVLNFLALKGTGKFGKENEPLPKWVSRIFQILPLLCFGMVLLVFIMCQCSDSFWQMLGSRGILKFTDEWGSYRGILWKVSLKEFFSGSFKEILFGVGPDCYGPWYMERGLAVHSQGYFEEAVYSNAHNEWITAMIQTGIPGLLVYLGVFVTGVLTFAKRIQRHPAAFTGVLVILMYGINQTFSFQHICVTPIFFIILGVCGKCLGREENRNIAEKS